jgi:hydrogenase nickel incorporation protein HypA/HybF
MHEMGIAASVLDAVQREMLRYPGRRPAKVGLRIGEMAGVDGESVQFCFGVLVKGSEFEPLELAIEGSAGDELEFAFLELDDSELDGKEETAAA